MKRGRDPQSEASFDERRNQIKKAALKVFASRGIGGAKMSMIAAEAGISQGLSYRYFSSKEELLTLLVREAIEEGQTAMADFGRLPGTPKEQLGAFTRRMLSEEHKPYFMLLQQVQASDETPEEVRAIVGKYAPEDTLGHLIPIFVKGQQLGEFREGDPQRLLFLYFSVIAGLMLQEAPVAPDYWLQEVDSLMRLIAR